MQARHQTRNGDRSSTDKATVKTLISANVTSWRSAVGKFKNWQADYLALQEVRLNKRGQLVATRAADAAGYNIEFGAACAAQTFQRSRSRYKICTRVRQGGTAILAKKSKAVLVPSGRKWHAAKELFTSARHIRAALVSSSKNNVQTPVHISCGYLESGSTSTIKARRERQLELLMEDAAALGDQAVYLCLDTNTKIRRSATLKKAIASGHWHDLGAVFAPRRGKKRSKKTPRPTFGKDPRWNRKSWVLRVCTTSARLG